VEWTEKLRQLAAERGVAPTVLIQNSVLTQLDAARSPRTPRSAGKVTCAPRRRRLDPVEANWQQSRVPVVGRDTLIGDRAGKGLLTPVNQVAVWASERWRSDEFDRQGCRGEPRWSRILWRIDHGDTPIVA
jgi:hypothetical protein